MSNKKHKANNKKRVYSDINNSLNNTFNTLNMCIKNNDMELLKKELESLEKDNIMLPRLLYYYDKYYRRTYNIKEGYPYLKKYIFDMPKEHRTSEFLYYLRQVFSLISYEDVFTDEEYIDLIKIINDLSKPEREIKVSLSDKRLFRTLKIGLISSDFRPHPVGFFILSLFSNKLNYQTVDYYAYDTSGKPNNIQKAISESVSMYHNVASFDDYKLSELILNDKLDILIDLNGLSTDTKINILTYRLAPLQLSWIGSPGTTAMYNIDYTIVDPVSDPPEISEKYYSEKLLHMDKTFLCFSYDIKVEENIINEPPFIKNGYVTIGSFTNPLKYSDDILIMWKEIMDRLPEVRFIIQSNFFECDDDISIQKQKFSKYGIDISRIEFQKKSYYKSYLENYNNVDFILDTYPFSGATTTCDAFNMGVPIITLCGKKHVSRVTASMLTNIGQADLIAYTKDEYIEKAVNLACDKEKLIHLRRTIKDKYIHSPLLDNISFKMELENKLRDIYIQYILNEYREQRASVSKEPFALANEALTSAFYIQYLISRENINLIIKIMDDFVQIHKALCLYLKKVHANNGNALQVLDRYYNLLSLTTVNTDTGSLKIIIDSILKIIGMFVR